MSEIQNDVYLETAQEEFEAARAKGDAKRMSRVLFNLRDNGFDTEAKSLQSLVNDETMKRDEMILDTHASQMRVIQDNL